MAVCFHTGHVRREPASVGVHSDDVCECASRRGPAQGWRGRALDRCSERRGINPLVRGRRERESGTNVEGPDAAAGEALRWTGRRVRHQATASVFVKREAGRAEHLPVDVTIAVEARGRGIAVGQNAAAHNDARNGSAHTEECSLLARER